ncbi:hypothetical protein Godav_017461, partial [Gossypium davidsonii]|nr:hypothetical protein [Gossypium davidsonii]
VTKLLEKEGIQWQEENRGTLSTKIELLCSFTFIRNSVWYGASFLLQVTYLFDKMEEWLGIVLLEVLQNGAAVPDFEKLGNLFYYCFDT